MSRKGRNRRYTVTRNAYKQIKAYDHSQMEEFLYRVYVNGYDDGRKSVPGVEVDDVLNALKEIRGIGPATMKKIVDVLEGQFGGKEGDKAVEEGPAKAG